ncbi:TPA: helicase, partial [Escherichia coli]|nr:helicase [Escherichia coli]
EDSVVKFDFDHLNRTQYRDLTRKFKNAPFFNILHTTASHQHVCKNGDYAFRVLVPARTPFNSNDAWMVQRAICAELEIDEALRDHCTEDGNRLIYLPHRESKITVTEGRVIRAERYIKKAEEMGLSKREVKTLAADEYGLNADIAHFCEAELGLDALSSGRGYEVPCPNEHLHTGKGSTSIMLDGKEVRFVCQHTNNGACTELNRRQHLALRMCGLPDELNVDKQPISINSIRAALPDLPDEEIEELHRTENEEPVTCTLEDLEEEDELPEPVKADFVVEGYMPSDCIWDIVGESGTY